MEILSKNQRSNLFSQRKLAQLAGISYKSLQLIEAGHDTRVSTLSKIAVAIGFTQGSFERCARIFFDQNPNSVFATSLSMLCDAQHGLIYFFNFVDAFRSSRDAKLFTEPPANATDKKMKALLAATVETLCDELNLAPPSWCDSVLSLDVPWFVAGIENLKASAVVEAPLHFKKRNIFVLGNFLERA